MSYEIDGLVETSANLATASIEGDQLKVHVSSRGSVESSLHALLCRIEAISLLAGARVQRLEGYPGWKPDLSSRLLALARRIHRETLGVEAHVKAIHAGLECGIIKKKFPEMDMISVGPEIQAPHSPDERVKIPSVCEFYRFLKALLSAVPQSPLS